MKYIITIFAVVGLIISIAGCKEGFHGDLDTFKHFDEMEGPAAGMDPTGEASLDSTEPADEEQPETADLSDDAAADLINSSEIFNNGPAYVTKDVTVRGKIAPMQMMCTLMACLDGTNCCNSCSGSMGIIDEDASDILKAIRVTPAASLATEFLCGGNMCDPTCTPLAKDAVYDVTGTVKVDVTNKYYIEVTSFEAIE